jgi:hypothetical protein
MTPASTGAWKSFRIYGSAGTALAARSELGARLEADGFRLASDESPDGLAPGRIRIQASPTNSFSITCTRVN